MKKSTTNRRVVFICIQIPLSHRNQGVNEIGFGSGLGLGLGVGLGLGLGNGIGLSRVENG